MSPLLGINEVLALVRLLFGAAWATPVQERRDRDAASAQSRLAIDGSGGAGRGGRDAGVWYSHFYAGGCAQNGRGTRTASASRF